MIIGITNGRMLVFTRGYAMHPGHIEMILISLFSSQMLANYVVVQRWILPRDIIKEVPLRTVTSCVMKCSVLDKCANVGFRKSLATSKNDKCLLIRMLRKKNKNGTRIKIYALVDVNNDIITETQLALKAPVCGGWTQWNVTSPCNATCDGGVLTKTRNCSNPPPTNGGEACKLTNGTTGLVETLVVKCNINKCTDPRCTLKGCADECTIFDNKAVCGCKDPTKMLHTDGKSCVGFLQLMNASQSSSHNLYPPSKALDGELLFKSGDKSSLGCALTLNEQDAWWKAELLEPSFITKINIVPRRQGTWQKRYTRVTVLTSVDGIKWKLCADLGDKMKKITKGWVDATCPVGAFGKFIKLVQHNNDEFAVCEVKVMGYIGGKVPLVNPSQSSTSTYSGQDWSASNALDGILSLQDKSPMGCSHTKNDQNPWWKAQMVQTSYISKIRIIGRIDSYQYRYTHVSISTSMDGNKWILCADLGDKLLKAKTWVEATCAQGTIARYLKVVQHNGHDLILCEVEVFGYT